MKKQVLVIHGGTTFTTYREYLSFLKSARIELDEFRSGRSDWKDNLQKNLGEFFDVLRPTMPNGKNAKYKEWQIWFEKIIPLLNKEIILVGHSMGGIFLAKYLSENRFPKTILATILVAAPFNDEGGESLGDFNLPKSLAKFEKQSREIFLIYSTDDPSVPFSKLEKYKKALPNAKTLIFKDRGHFRLETFPEIAKLIKNIYQTK